MPPVEFAIRVALDEMAGAFPSENEWAAINALRAVVDRIADFYAGKSTGAFAATLLADIAEHLGVTDV